MGTYAGTAAVDGAVHIAVTTDGGANLPTLQLFMHLLMEMVLLL